jgi:hypothetical protein
MRRWLFRIVLLLAIGAVINVAVAWGLAIRPASGFLEWYWTTSETRAWGLTIYPGEIWIQEGATPYHEYGRTGLTADEFRALLPAWSQLVALQPSEEFLTTDDFSEHATGWPMHSMRSFEAYFYEEGLPDVAQRTTGGVLTLPPRWLPTLPSDGTIFSPVFGNELPCIPIWPGFYVNTLLYACAAWLVFFAPFTALRFTKRARRQRKGLCLCCGYDLRGSASASDACPEAVARPQSRAREGAVSDQSRHFVSPSLPQLRLNTRGHRPRLAWR